MPAPARWSCLPSISWGFAAVAPLSFPSHARPAPNQLSCWDVMTLSGLRSAGLWQGGGDSREGLHLWALWGSVPFNEDPRDAGNS